MTSEHSQSLLSVKEQIEKMFETMHNLETGDRNEAIGYLHKCLKINDNIENEEPEVKRKLKNKKRVKVSPIRSVKKPKLKCRICDSLHQTKTSFLNHLETHVSTPISCKLCKRSFNNKTSFSCHSSLKMCRKRSISSKKYYCDQCPKIFRYIRQYGKHVEGHKRNNCTYCDVRITRRKDLALHLLTKHSIKLERSVMFKCHYCEKRYVKKQSLYHHLKQHVPDKIVCMECGNISDNSDALKEHSIKHIKDKPWNCPKCKENFSRRQQYLIHMKRSCRYKCITCEEYFAVKSLVLAHKHLGHVIQDVEPQIKCPKCPKAFQRRLALQIHMKKHSDDKIMHCKYCNKNFRSPYLYFKHCATSKHEINSPETQPLVCEICGKLFMKKYRLDQHLIRVHANTKKMLTCQYCDHKTNSKTNMERHLSLHLEDKKDIICELCGKAFYNIVTLKDHISYMHRSQGKVFKCNQCDKAFKKNSELERHKTTHSSVRKHVCQLCGVTYKRSTHLRRHEETKHGAVTRNRRVQRLTKDSNGELVPVAPEKKAKKPEASTSTNQQILSIMDVQFGDIADNIIMSNEQGLYLVNSFDPNFASQILGNDQYSDIF